MLSILMRFLLYLYLRFFLLRSLLAALLLKELLDDRRKVAVTQHVHTVLSRMENRHQCQFIFFLRTFQITCTTFSGSCSWFGLAFVANLIFLWKLTGEAVERDRKKNNQMYLRTSSIRYNEESEMGKERGTKTTMK